MALSGTHQPGDTGRIADDNLRDSAINSNTSRITTLETTVAGLAGSYQGPIKYVSTGTGVLTDGTECAAAINTFIASTPVGSTVVFDGGKTYGIATPIKYLPGRRYTSSGNALGAAPATIKLTNSANPNNASGVGFTGLLVPNAWDLNTTGSTDGSVLIDNLKIDGNKANNTSSNASGVVVCSPQTRVLGCSIVNTPLDAIRQTDKTKNNTQLSIALGAECQFIGNKIDNVGGSAFRQQASLAAQNADGVFRDNIITTVGASAVLMERGQRWKVDGNRMSGVNNDGININNAVAASVQNNYVQDFGASGGSGLTWNGVKVVQLDGLPSTVANNAVICGNEAGAATYRFYSLLAGASSPAARVFFQANSTTGSAGALAFGVYLGTNGGTGALTVVAGNSNSFTGHASGKTSLVGSGVTHDLAAMATIAYVDETYGNLAGEAQGFYRSWEQGFVFDGATDNTGAFNAVKAKAMLRSMAPQKLQGTLGSYNTGAIQYGGGVLLWPSAAGVLGNVNPPGVSGDSLV